eukprot:1557-Pelagococcus_subviridis.AAC.1
MPYRLDLHGGEGEEHHVVKSWTLIPGKYVVARALGLSLSSSRPIPTRGANFALSRDLTTPPRPSQVHRRAQGLHGDDRGRPVDKPRARGDHREETKAGRRRARRDGPHGARARPREIPHARRRTQGGQVLPGRRGRAAVRGGEEHRDRDVGLRVQDADADDGDADARPDRAPRPRRRGDARRERRDRRSRGGDGVRSIHWFPYDGVGVVNAVP